MPRYRIRRAIGWMALALLLALAAFVGWRWHVVQAASARRASAASAIVPPPHAPAPRTAAALDAPLPASVKPDQAARWIARADTVSRRKRERQYGEDAPLAALPPTQAWQQTTALAHEGDSTAAALALNVAQHCAALRRMPEASRIAQYRERTRASLAPAWRDWLVRIDTEIDRRSQAELADCAGVGNELEFASLALDRFLQSPDPEAQVALAEDTEDDAEAIANLRAIAAHSNSPAARRALGERMLRAGNAEGLQLLLDLAPDDERAVEILAGCYHQGCGRFPADPTAGAAWLEQAAGRGYQPAIGWRIEDLTRQNAIALAWAWSMYRVQLAMDGCFQYSLNTAWLEDAVRNATALDGRLPDTDRAAALGALQALGLEWLALAEQDMDCGP